MRAFGEHRGLQAVPPLGEAFAVGKTRFQPVARAAPLRSDALPSIASAMRTHHAYLQHVANPIYKVIPAAHAPSAATPGKPGYRLQITGFTI